MSFEDNYLPPDQPDRPVPEESLPLDSVRKEIEAMDENAGKRIRLRWLRENVAPFSEEEEKQRLKEFLAAGNPEDYADFPEVTVESNSGSSEDDLGDLEVDELSDEEVAREIERREDILRQRGDFSDLSEALEAVERLPGSDKFSDEDLAVMAERLVKKKVDKKELERVRKEINEITK
ncbi:MAG TPA: hypothetical protein VMC41_02370 [Candidatus Nanoarchaeia archaeon]|nr:hypothetical protein [Candidatus Nanoarchaeia archaeon]